MEGQTKAPAAPSVPVSGGTSLRMAWLDGLRALAVFCVVLVHTRVSAIVYGQVPATRAAWLLAWFCQPYVRLGVPLFTVISGYLLLAPGRRDGLLAFYARRARRILPALFAWHVIYALLVSGHLFYNPWGLMHLWFLWSLIALYLATPLLRVLVGKVPPRVLLLLSLAAVAATTLTPLRAAQTRDTIAAAFFVRSLLLLPFYLLGGSLHGLRPLRGGTVLLLALAGPVLRPPTYGLWHAGLAAALIVWMRGRETAGMRFMAAIGRRSFGMYLVHRAFELWLVQPLWGRGPLHWYVIPTESALVMAISYGVCWAYDVVRGSAQRFVQRARVRDLPPARP